MGRAIQRTFVVAVCAIAGIAETSWGRYNPHQGRWTTRDPAGILEEGAAPESTRASEAGPDASGPLTQYADGPNLYEYAQGQPLQRTDPTGRRSGSFYFYAVDLGQHNPEPYYRWFRRTGTIAGATRLKEWTAGVQIVPCASDGCKVEGTGGRGQVEYWWSTQSSRSHELVHVGIYRTNYLTVVQQIRGLESKGCMCSRRRTSCYAGLAGKFSSYYRELADAENDEFDCRTYGQDFPEACQAARQAREHAAGKAAQLNKAIYQCESMKD